MEGSDPYVYPLYTPLLGALSLHLVFRPKRRFLVDYPFCQQIKKKNTKH
jgi:hypothetical protein